MSGDSKQVWSRATAAVLMAVLLVLSGCVGFLDSGGTPTAESTPTETTSVSETAVPTSESTPTVTETETATATGTGTATSTETPSNGSENAENRSDRSEYIQQFRDLTDDNRGEFREAHQINNSLYANYTLSNSSFNQYTQSIRDYAIDFVTVIRDTYDDNESESWEVREMVGYVHHPNGTALAQYHIYDYWVLLVDDYDRVTTENLGNMAVRTTTTYNAESSEWNQRSIYINQFEDNANAIINRNARNITASREGQTITVSYTSTAENRTVLIQEIESILVLYADLMDNYYRTDINGWNLDFTHRPAILEIAIHWQGERYIWGRTSAWEAQNYNYNENEEWELSNYIQDFLDLTWEDENRLHAQP